MVSVFCGVIRKSLKTEYALPPPPPLGNSIVLTIRVSLINSHLEAVHSSSLFAVKQL